MNYAWFGGTIIGAFGRDEAGYLSYISLRDGAVSEDGLQWARLKPYKLKLRPDFNVRMVVYKRSVTYS